VKKRGINASNKDSPSVRARTNNPRTRELFLSNAWMFPVYIPQIIYISSTIALIPDNKSIFLEGNFCFILMYSQPTITPIINSSRRGFVRKPRYGDEKG
ncbi:hypothetical protein KXT86_26955, partial [Salmonella enterica subsp. enterica serovar Weltevreden]|nr:hypothetical protein [Salmonella enterica subsp. enterica serovar Weltevreden]